MSSVEEWSFFQDESGHWRWLHIDAAGERSISPSGFDTEDIAKKHAIEFGYTQEGQQAETVTNKDKGDIVADEKTKSEEWYFFRTEDTKWRWLKITADGKRQISKEGFTTEEIARGAASQNGFTGEGKVIRQPISLQNLKTKSSAASAKKPAAGAQKDDEWHFFEDGEGKWRWLRISPAGKRHVSPVGFASVKLARANAKNFGYHGIRFNRA